MVSRMLLILYLTGAAGFLFPATSWGGCGVYSPWNNKPVIFNFPAQIIVQADAAPGSVIYEHTFDFNGAAPEQFAGCGDGTASGFTQYANGWTADSNGIAATNVPGVGIRIYFSRGDTKNQVPNARIYPADLTDGGSGFYWGYAYSNIWQIQLIKTGPISGGKLQSGGYVSFGMDEGNRVLVATLTNGGGGGTIVPVGCTVTTPTVAVPLGQRKKSDFTGPGSTTPWQDFSVTLNCNKNARINVRIDATPDSLAGPQGVMRLDKEPGDMAATGIGIQIGYRPDGSLVQFGEEKYYRTSQSGGNENVELRARYYQTAQNVTAGKANGTATFTLTYK
ncbi:TPA: fimbrial protein [Salmonella enterica subsp. enterica serovar Eastbourne]|nr:fimbrial protein [Salmonella enterica subsp. enterica serovar Eastbourne]HDN7576327.1 fimbrial protein [Salmonella enterica subsp. enterica serovar Eastbourne]